ncbi:hypothetical protein BH11ARM1_BH11ARM1_12140 [soil metagenome]
MDIFDFSKALSFPPVRLGNETDEEELRSIKASHIRAKVYAHEDKGSGQWLLQVGEYLRDIGSYRESFLYSNRARSVAIELGDTRLLVQVLCLQCACELLLGSLREAKMHREEIAAIAQGSVDPHIVAASSFTFGAYLTRGEVTEPDGPSMAIAYFHRSAETYQQLGEIDLCIKAMVEEANAYARTAEYIMALRKAGEALDFAVRHRAWKFAGRILLIIGTAATDQGYRNRVEDILQEALRWSRFVGDLWAEVHSLHALGRLLAFDAKRGDIEGPKRSFEFFQTALDKATAHGLARVSTELDVSTALLHNKLGSAQSAEKVLSHEKYLEKAGKRILGEALSSVADVEHSSSLRVSQRIRHGVEDSPDPFFVFDARRDQGGRIVDLLNEFHNEAAAALLGLSHGSVFMYSEIASNPHFIGLSEPITCAVDGRVPYQDDCAIESMSEQNWYRRRILPSSDGVVVTFRDITKERAQIARLHESANHDSLTGLPNRLAFDLQLETACSAAQRDGSQHALCYIDLDRFKEINDKAGHAAGDYVLREFGTLLRQLCRAQDMPARIGGDEFAVVFLNCSIEQAFSLAGRLSRHLSSHGFEWQGKSHRVGASIGIAPIVQESCDPIIVFELADKACYFSKSAGRGLRECRRLSEVHHRLRRRLDKDHKP